LLDERSKRTRPGLDDKILCSWNAMMISAYCEAANSFGNKTYLECAIQNGKFILERMRNPDGSLMHSYKNGKQGSEGFLEDYAFTIEALIRLYESTIDEHWLEEARRLADYTLQHFYDESSGLFWYTSGLSAPLIARKKEIYDNVIPSSNSCMAKNLFQLGNYFGATNYLEISRRMLSCVTRDMPSYGSGFSNWATLLLWQTGTYFELAVTGNEANEKLNEARKSYLPNVQLAGDDSGKSRLSLLSERFVPQKTLFYLCQNNSCKLPVSTFDEIRQQIH